MLIPLLRSQGRLIRSYKNILTKLDDVGADPGDFSRVDMDIAGIDEDDIEALVQAWRSSTGKDMNALFAVFKTLGIKSKSYADSIINNKALKAASGENGYNAIRKFGYALRVLSKWSDEVAAAMRQFAKKGEVAANVGKLKNSNGSITTAAFETAVKEAGASMGPAISMLLGGSKKVINTLFNASKSPFFKNTMDRKVADAIVNNMINNADIAEQFLRALPKEQLTKYLTELQSAVGVGGKPFKSIDDAVTWMKGRMDAGDAITGAYKAKAGKIFAKVVAESIENNTQLWEYVYKSMYGQLKAWKIDWMKLATNKAYRQQFAKQLNPPLTQAQVIQGFSKTGNVIKSVGDMLVYQGMYMIKNTIAILDPKKWDIIYNDIQDAFEQLGMPPTKLDANGSTIDNYNGVPIMNFNHAFLGGIVANVLSKDQKESLKQQLMKWLNLKDAITGDNVGLTKKYTFDPVLNVIKGFYVQDGKIWSRPNTSAGNVDWSPDFQPVSDYAKKRAKIPVLAQNMILNNLRLFSLKAATLPIAVWYDNKPKKSDNTKNIG
jgi:hypothetical protein